MARDMGTIENQLGVSRMKQFISLVIIFILVGINYSTEVAFAYDSEANSVGNELSTDLLYNRTIKGQVFKNTIYVNDDNVVGPWTGSYQYPYRLIQDALDNTSANDIITVANGTYYEHLIIPSHLNSITINYWSNSPGELDDFRPTLIGNGTGTGILIDANYVKISMLKLTNFGQGDLDAGIYLDETIEACQIQNCDIANCSYGIWIKRQNPVETYHIIEANTIHDIRLQGIVMELCENNKIRNNMVSNCDHGIAVFDCNRNTIDMNNCINNSVGIFLSNRINNKNQKTKILNIISNQGSEENIISNNVCNGNRIDGIALKGIKMGSHNIIENNICFNNFKGIAVRDSKDVIIQQNWCAYNEQGILINNADVGVVWNNCSNNKIGIYLYGTSGNKSSGGISNNICYNNSLAGIALLNCTSSSILDNQIEYCWNGIWIERSFINMIQNNDIINNNGIGIILTLTIGNLITNNNIYNNSRYDIAGILGFANARHNYWGGGLPKILLLGWVRFR
jgi:parallel beta-helix repeat protein